VILDWDETKTSMAVPGLMQMRLGTGLEWPQARDRLCHGFGLTFLDMHKNKTKRKVN